MTPKSRAQFCFTFEVNTLLAYIRLLAIVRRGGRASQMAEAFEEVFCSLDAHSRGYSGRCWSKLGQVQNTDQIRKKGRWGSKTIGWGVDQWKGLAQLSPKKAQQWRVGKGPLYRHNLVVPPQAVEFKVQKRLTLTLNSCWEKADDIDAEFVLRMQMTET